MWHIFEKFLFKTAVTLIAGKSEKLRREKVADKINPYHLVDQGLLENPLKGKIKKRVKVV